MCELNWISVAKKKFHTMAKNIYFSYCSVKCFYLEVIKGEIEQALPAVSQVTRHVVRDHTLLHDIKIENCLSSSD